MLTNDQAVEVIVGRLDTQDAALREIKSSSLKTEARITLLETNQQIRDAVSKSEREMIAENLRKHERITGWWRALVLAGVGSAFGSFAYLVIR